ncbi:MAG: DegT/DnrJ/EryC1/StrS aminotransferase family protein [Gemmatimonadetes bacterium]|jgi:perosamine synthetase|nr:DegT/DnrJ/EryC1/StrS aminotransferase family protein [Gemmatimonadota bacterium]
MKIAIPHSRPTLGEAEAEAVHRVVLSGQLVQGREVAVFEEEVAAFTGRRFAVAVSSGTAGLHLALLALEVGEGDEVILPSYVCTALLHAAWAAGSTPVAVDVDPSTRNLDVGRVREKLGERTRAIIAPHMFGLPAPVEEIEELDLPVIEDCAMSIGAEHRGRPVGSFGRLSVCSFYTTKMMAAGEGGMVLTDDPELAERVRARREYDGLPASHLRFNYKMTDVEAALGRVQLVRLPEFVARRREVAVLYQRGLVDSGLKLPLENPEHVYYRYILRAGAGAEPFMAALEEEGVAARRPIDRPLHRELGGEDGEYPHATAAHRKDVSIPIYPSLGATEIDRVIKAVLKVAAGS